MRYGYTIIYVSSVEETAAKVVNNGGKIIKPKQSIPGVGYIDLFFLQ